MTAISNALRTLRIYYEDIVYFVRDMGREEWDDSPALVLAIKQVDGGARIVRSVPVRSDAEDPR